MISPNNKSETQREHQQDQAPENENIKAAYEQAEADIEDDNDLGDISGPNDDLDEEESVKQSGDKSDIV